MERCFWELKLDEGLLLLSCDFGTAPFSTCRKMQIVCEAGGALSSVLLSRNLPCFIGTGPSNADKVQDSTWYIALVPDMEDLPDPVLELRMKHLVSEMRAFCLHLNQTPRSSQLDPKADPTLN